MSLPRTLQRFDRFNKFSPEFPGILQQLDRPDLSSPISSPAFSPQKEYKDCVLELRDECATWLIEYLDNVRLPVVLYWLFVQQV